MFLKKLFMLAYYARASARHPAAALAYLRESRETDNFTYPVANASELIAFAARAAGITEERAGELWGELDGDRALAREIAEAYRARPDRDPRADFGRRLVWYVLVRAKRPRRVIETGVHDGLGSVALLAALERNAADGIEGTLVGVDIDPEAGWLVPGRMRKRYRFVTGDSVQALAAWPADEPVDVFMHDSAHTYAHERAELDAVWPRLAPGALLISDNAHVTTALADFAAARGLRFSFVREVPQDHFYPGGGVGVAS